MAIVVVGGDSRRGGEKSGAAAIIARLPEMHWTAFKITQFGHGFCTANGEPCDCQTDEHTIAFSEERAAATWRPPCPGCAKSWLLRGMPSSNRTALWDSCGRTST